MDRSKLVPALASSLDRLANQRILIGQGSGGVTGGAAARLIARVVAGLENSAIAPRPGVVVIHGRPSLESALIIYGVLLSGRTYCFLDHYLPPGQAEAIAAQTPISAVLHDDTVSPEGLKALGISGCPRQTFQQLFDKPEAVSIDRDMPPAEQTAYVLFTSGSTGVPKGACVSHEAAWRAQQLYWQCLHINLSDIIANEVMLSFDVSTFDLFGIVPGATLAFAATPGVGESALSYRKFLAESEATLTFTVPSVARHLAQNERDLGSLPLRKLALTGEPIDRSLVQQLHQAFPQARLFNLFGMTEAPYLLAQELIRSANTPENSFPFPAEEGVKLRIDSEGGLAELEDAAPGTRGELVIGGDILCNGYIDPTGAALAHRVVSWQGFGDYFEVLPGRRLRFLGRKERIARIWGVNVYLDQVESILRSHRGVSQAVVMQEGDRQSLVCAIEPTDPSTAAPDELVVTLKRHCARLLDRYQTPKHWRVMERLPRTASGKIDRQALAGLLGK